MVVELLMADQPERDVAHDGASHFWDMADANELKKAVFQRLRPIASHC